MANSFVRYTGNGTTTTYAIPFSYRDSADLSATVAGVNVTAYTLDAAGTNLTFTTAPANGAAIEIRRTTSQSTKLVDYVSGSVLTENDLDTDSDQAFYMSQEAIDKAGDVITLDNADFQWDVQSKRLKNVANPVDNTDAVNKQFISTNLPNITTVAGISSDVTTVAGISSDVTAVAADATDIGTVSANIASVNTVATNINDVIKVADDLNEAISEVETVANDLNEATSEIEVVANNIANVNTVGTNITNVNTVAGIDANVTTVAGISADVTSVAGISTAVSNVNSNSTNINAVNANSANINTVAGIDSDVTSVAGISSAVTAVNNNSSNINAVNSNSANINTVAGNNTNINTVASNDTNITTVAGISSNVTTVAGISSDVTAVAGDATDIGTVATNLTGTNTIGTVAGSIANVNNVGGSIANVNTVATNIASVNNFGEVYRISATAPTTSLDAGDLYFDTATDTLKVYGSSGWQNAGSSVNGTSQRYNYTATSGQTTFTGADNNGNTLTYDAGYIDVYLNGVKLLNGTDVTVTSGSSVVLASGATTGDVVDIVAYGTFSVASLNADNLDSGTVPSARISGAYTGITQTGTLASFASTGIDDNATSTAVTIDSSENFMVGKTTSNYTSPGVEAKSNGNLIAVRDSGNVVNFVRNTNNGSIVTFAKDTTNLGSIGVDSNTDFFIEGLNNHSGIRFKDTSFVPRKGSSDADGTVSLGKSDGRFSDLYLSGGAYLGGTGTANRLDDYEEGTWTPVYKTSGNNYPSITYNAFTGGKYTKIGRTVFIQATLRTDAVDDTGTSGVIQIAGLPFASSGNTGSTRDGISALAINDQSDWKSGHTPNGGVINAGDTDITINQLYASTANVSNILSTDLQTGASKNRINIQGVYVTDA